MNKSVTLTVEHKGISNIHLLYAITMELSTRYPSFDVYRVSRSEKYCIINANCNENDFPGLLSEVYVKGYNVVAKETEDLFSH